jgi:copper chaperone CopZ
MEIIRLTIPNMKSHHCQMTVAKAVKEVGGNIRRLAPMQAEIAIESPVTKESVVKAIQTAGYTVSKSE